MKSVNIRFKDEDHEFLRQYSFNQRKSINQIINELVQNLRQEIEKGENATTAKQLRSLP